MNERERRLQQAAAEADVDRARLTKDTSREAAVAAETDRRMTGRALVAADDLLAAGVERLDPARRKALLAVLLPVEELAAAIHRWHNPGTATPCRPESNCHLTAAAIHRNLNLRTALATDGAET